MSNHYFYVLECNDGSYYGGYTTNIEKRILVHNEGKGAKYTRAKRPVQLIYNESFQSKKEAMKAEYYFKKLSRKNKERYIAGELPTLYREEGEN
ncbi:GIY-YIG nuclease family protein [Metabacillus arenae]|uniref:GIY-YIG nuclease family protein n=1 Tax=Metabacillus arenae TaxID=2771434 RepID=A0A926NKK7_9BACI|nr:GIY-YIG nuclease family protein [Metabacillus arenae]MBD1383514.1 GIY-YIG nuclease family protein [Metabacillus arenae]